MSHNDDITKSKKDYEYSSVPTRDYLNRSISSFYKGDGGITSNEVSMPRAKITYQPNSGIDRVESSIPPTQL